MREFNAVIHTVTMENKVHQRRGAAPTLNGGSNDNGRDDQDFELVRLGQRSWVQMTES
jgi:hypothetical protein